MAACPRRPIRSVLLTAAVAMAATLALAACGSGVQDSDAPPPTTRAPVTAPAATGDASTTTAAGGATTTAAAASPPTTTAGVPDPQPPGDLGDDDELDDLADECFAGDFSACDQLFFNSDADSAYEAYGDSCGGRNQPEGLCVTLYEDTQP